MEDIEFRDLKVYQLSFQLALEVFEISKSFPKEEKDTLTDQIRKSSRAVSALIAEAWTHRNYPKSFISKLTNSKGEVDETGVSIDFAEAHYYISKEKRQYLLKKYYEVNEILNNMINEREQYCQ
jgi:four helix bundle protein